MNWSVKMNGKGDLPVPFGGPLPSSTTETVEHHGQKEWSSPHQGEDEFWFKTGGKIKQIDIRLMYEHCLKEIHVSFQFVLPWLWSSIRLHWGEIQYNISIVSQK